MDRDARARGALFEMIEGIETAMLTNWDGELLRSRPMHTILDPTSGEISFFTTLDAEKTRDAARFEQIGLTWADQERKVWVSVSGRATLDLDRDTMRKHWNPFVAAWFPKGLDEPGLVLLRVVPEAAEYWDSTTSAMRYLWEVARANVTGQPPRVGRHEEVELAGKLHY